MLGNLLSGVHAPFPVVQVHTHFLLPDSYSIAVTMVFCVCVQGVNFACINHAKSDESEQSDCKAPQLASFAFRKKDVGKLEELLQVIQHETSSEAGSAAATSAV